MGKLYFATEDTEDAEKKWKIPITD